MNWNNSNWWYLKWEVKYAILYFKNGEFPAKLTENKNGRLLVTLCYGRLELYVRIWTDRDELLLESFVIDFATDHNHFHYEPYRSNLDGQDIIF